MTVSQTQYTASVTTGWKWACDLFFIDSLLPVVSYSGSKKNISTLYARTDGRLA
jgi:hypothetical protein